MTLLNGTKTNDLVRFVDGLTALLGRAIERVLIELTRSPANPPHLTETDDGAAATVEQ